MSEESGTDRARPCVDILAEHRDEVRRALGGRSLVVRLRGAGEGEGEGEGDILVVFTRSGFVTRMPVEPGTHVHAELDGTHDDLHAFLAGRVGLAEAVLRGVVRLRLPESDVTSYAPLRTLVADLIGRRA